MKLIANTKETILPKVRKFYKRDRYTDKLIPHWIPDLHMHGGRLATNEDAPFQVQGLVDALRGQADAFVRGIITGSSKFHTSDGELDQEGKIGYALRVLAKSFNQTWQTYSRKGSNKAKTHKGRVNENIPWEEDSSGLVPMETMISFLKAGRLNDLG